MHHDATDPSVSPNALNLSSFEGLSAQVTPMLGLYKKPTDWRIGRNHPELSTTKHKLCFWNEQRYSTHSTFEMLVDLNIQRCDKQEKKMTRLKILKYTFFFFSFASLRQHIAATMGKKKYQYHITTRNYHVFTLQFLRYNVKLSHYFVMMFML